MDKPRIRLGHVIAASREQGEAFSGVPIMYEVMGVAMPPKIVVGHVDHMWRVMRGFGDPGSQWVGAFDDPTSALTALAADLGVEAETLPSAFQVHDGIAQQDSNGRWTVYEVDHNRVAVVLEGPFDLKSQAIERLRALVPVEHGDQWVIDAFGIAQTLN